MASSEDLTALRQAVDGLTAELKESKEDRRGLHRRNRLQTVGLAVLTVVSGLSTWAAVSAHDASGDAKAASNKANSAAHAAYSNCTNANAARDDNRDLWNSVIGTLGPISASAQGKAFIANLHADVDKLTAHRPCRPA